MKAKFLLFFITIFITFLSSCQRTSSFCSPGTIRYRDPSDPFPLIISDQENPQTLEVKRKNINFDQVISGQLCNNYLAGTVFVGCDIEIYAWEEKSTFLDNCNFEVKPGTIIYVASHNNTAYYKGCDSCHMSDEKQR